MSIFLLISCSKKEENIVAQVNKDTLTLSELKANFSNTEWKSLGKEKKKEFVQQWIKMTLLAQEADKERISNTEVLKQRIETATKKIKSNALLSLKYSEIKISENELFNYYKLHKGNFQKKIKEYKIQRILVDNKTKLDLVLNELKNGMKFAEAAQKYSVENIGKNGGYAGFFSPQQLGKKTAAKISKLKKWQYTTVQTNKGYYILRYYNTRIKTIEKTFFEVKDEIKQIVLKNKKKELYQRLLDDLKSESEISVSI